MPFITECASAIKKRFGKPDQSSESVPSTRSSPELFKSASKESLFNSSSALVRSYSVVGDDGASTRSFELSEDPSFWKDHNVQVIIRLRPLSSSEISVQGHSRCVKQDSAQTITWTGHPESRFTFDVVADENVSQEMLFQVAGVPMVENCVGGYNSCMFAYGQTGSGKTHTMLGDIEGGTRRHSVNCGMTPRVFEYLFSRIQKEREARREEKLRFTCKCSFLEIYNEQILDLLDPASTNLQIREDTKKGVYVENLTEVEVTSAREVLQQLVQGSANRKVAATNMNHASSRSHSVFTCIIESKWESQGVTHYRFARLNLVDLAGSERQKSSGAEGERLKEATNINKSLSTLGLVIMNLVSISNGKSQHVPYRDSKLTFLLQDSLGGNSKTIIIANISPSSCCSLETLSTLKFAQRAKFIKNHAIVNEDASGDVLAMRMQIQQLKKEVARLKGLPNGGAENHDSDARALSFPGSPGSFKWDGLYGSLSPLLSDKRASSNKEYEVALVGAFRREKDRDMTLQTLTAEVQAAMQLAKQREDEIQGLKMRLRFREAGIKRLEAVASGKISAEEHLLKEKEEHLKEIEVLRAQVDRNQEVTRFAMENLKLKEEIRRLKSFCEEGERESMNEQIVTLQNKLLEALDWKLMHESDPSTIQKGNSDQAADCHSDGDLLASSLETGSLVNEENEFLRMQAIQNQSEIDLLQKKLSLCLEEKEKLERKINELVSELEAERSLKIQNEVHKLQVEHPSLSTDQIPNLCLNDQTEELEAMVDAIAAASQREAEAHETTFKWSRENEELRMKIKVLIDDNNKLIELYERAVSDNADKSRDQDQDPEKSETEYQQDDFDKLSLEKELGLRQKVENLEQQLTEMHEENEKLMVHYEKAMQERDEFKRKLSLEAQNVVERQGDLSFPEKLVEVDRGESHDRHQSPCFQAEDLDLENLKLSDDGSMPAKEIVFPGLEEQQRLSNLFHEDSHCSAAVEPDLGNNSELDLNSLNLTTVLVSQEMNLIRTKLNAAEEKLASSFETVGLVKTVKEAIDEVDSISREVEILEEAIKVKQQEYSSLGTLSSQMNEQAVVVDRKLMALKYSISSFSASVAYFEQREGQAQTRVNTSLSYLDRNKEKLASLEAKRCEYIDAQRKIEQLETQLTNNIAQLTSKLHEESRRQDSEKVLFAIDNVEKSDDPHVQRSMLITGKATELLKSQEEKTKIQIEINQRQERLKTTRKENEDLNKKLKKVENEAQAICVEIGKASKSVEEMEHKLRDVSEEKEMLLEMKENGSAEVQNTIIEYYQHIIEAELKKEEMKILDEEMKTAFDRVLELQKAKLVASERKNQLLGGLRFDSCLEEIQDAKMSMMQMKTLLGDDS